VQLFNLSNPAQLYSELQAIRPGVQDGEISAFENRMNSLGRRLITPVVSLLRKTIYFAPAGQLLGLPFDALRFNNRYLLENHLIVNLSSFPAKPEPSTQVLLKLKQNVFLAGHPQDYSSQFLDGLDTSTEIQAVADIFIGPGLSIIQGAALLPDELESESFRQADLIHLAMNGVIDLRYPEQSSFELSGIEDQLERATFGPLEIRRQPLNAGLVFLSDTKVQDSPISDFNDQPALITDFLRTGAKVVIANFWGMAGIASEALITDFYQKLEGSGDIAKSLQSAKLQYLKANNDDGLYDWAGFQLYLE
jgi:CHAT domain-containing protein